MIGYLDVADPASFEGGGGAGATSRGCGSYFKGEAVQEKMQELLQGGGGASLIQDDFGDGVLVVTDHG